MTADGASKPLYGVDDKPAHWWESLLYGWQHTLVDISPFVLPLAVATAVGLSSQETAQFLNFGLVAMGVATLVQTTIGNRLPIIQGPSATLIGTLAPVAQKVGGAGMWGAVAVGGVLEAILGASGMVGKLRRYLPPAVSGAVIVTIGLTLGQLAVRLSLGDGSPRHLGFSLTILILVVLLQVLGRSLFGGLIARGAIFFSIWLVGLGLGSACGAVDWSLVADKPWFSLPRLFPYGGPWLGEPGVAWVLVPAATGVVLAGYFGSMVESLGDYAATCEVSGVRYEERHMNRGLFAEGLGCVLAACLGGLPCTSYTQNIGIIATTRVASRFVVRLAACVLILYGLCPKFGALLVAMPRSVLGGVFVLVCGMITVSGVRLLASGAVSSKSTLVVGLTLVVANGLPIYARASLDWLEDLPLAVSLLVTNAVVLAVVIGVSTHFVLDLLPDEEP